MKNPNRYNNLWMLIGIPVSVILATVIGTPHTIWDGILYQKIIFNLSTGLGIWLFYYWVILKFDRKMPWESTDHLRRWMFQLMASVPIACIFNYTATRFRNHLFDWPFSSHIFFYTDIPVLIFISVVIHFIYQQQYIRHQKSKNVESNLSAESAEPEKPPHQLTVKKGKKNYLIPIDEIAYFYRKDQYNFLRKWDGQEWMLDQSLAAIEQTVDAQQFFRINRKLIVNRKAISSFKVLDTRQTELEIIPLFQELALLNKNRSAQFKQWLQEK